MIRRAALAADRAFEALTAETWVGRSERELAWRLRQLLHAHGVDHLAFDTAIASGPNGSKPARRAGRRPDRAAHASSPPTGAPGSTATAPTARARSRPASSPAQLREIYDVCLAAQQAAVEAIRPGMTRRRGRPRSRASVIDAAGYGDNFGHGLGHGVGLVVHEAPRLSTESADVLEAGNVITVEPGIYLPGPRRRADRGSRRRARPTGVELLTSSRRTWSPSPEAPRSGASRDASAEPALDWPPPWPRSSRRTSSRTACTSSSTGRPGASSSSSTSSRARAAPSSARS